MLFFPRMGKKIDIGGGDIGGEKLSFGMMFFIVMREFYLGRNTKLLDKYKPFCFFLVAIAVSLRKRKTKTRPVESIWV